ncbi:MAG TPA: twin-arginine translocation signal domain-containing protein, partial [Flavisolibacter sp.]|nr:twin-arginine translocation signal domain-containing protein [Flavisolibacter sp.]
MKRRSFLQQSTLAGAALFTNRTLPVSQITEASEQPFHLDYAPHDGMFKASAGASFTDQIRFAYDAGFRSVEDNGFMDRPVKEQEAIGNLLAKLGMRMGV